MSLLSKNINDQFFTPKEIVNQFHRLLPDLTNLSVLDPCCGPDKRLTIGLNIRSLRSIDLIHTNDDFLLFKEDGFEVCLMNPPFSLVKEFLIKATFTCNITYAILPSALLKPANLRWFKFNNLNLEYLEESCEKYFELPNNQLRGVNTFIGKIKLA